MPVMPLIGNRTEIEMTALKHEWKYDQEQATSLYDDWYKCENCRKRFMVSADAPERKPPLKGCVGKQTD